MLFKSKSVHFLSVVSIIGMFMLVGCGLAQPSASNVPEVVESTIARSETLSGETAVNEEGAGQIQDRAALADYQRQLADGKGVADDNLWRFETAETAAADNLPGQMPNQLTDRTALATYQMRMGDWAVTASSGSKSATVNDATGQIPDHQALAEYQFHLSDGNVGQPETLEIAEVVGLPGQIVDHQALAEYQFLLGSGQIGR